MDDKVLRRAIKKFGKEKQTIVAIEEMSELTKELTKSLRGCNRTSQITEEMADVYIMLHQVRLMYGIRDELLSDYINLKVCRLENNLNERK